MRLFGLLLTFLSPLLSISQESPVVWSISSDKSTDSTWTILVSATIQPNWYLYAKDDRENELNAVHLSWNNLSMKAIGKLESGGSEQTIHDPIFGNSQQVFKGVVLLRQTIHTGKTVPASLKVKVSGYASNGEAFLPINEELELHFAGGVDAKSKRKLASVNLAKPKSECGDKQSSNKSLLAIFLLGIGGGLIALLTPCVFPMVPVTVSFFTSKAKNKATSIRNGVSYGLFIFLIYLLASIPFHLAGNINPQIFNTISTNAWVNVFFFVVFIFFALSFFGLFEIRLPSFIANKAGSNSSGGMLGIFFMALTLAIVSFSCTGPILGSLLVGSLSSSGGAWQLTAGMAGFGVALGLPFALFALFPHWLKKLPKSGGWMETVKKTLAFIELALAVKFLSNADLVEHWGILKREIFIGLWVLIFLSLAVYLLNIHWRIKYGTWKVSTGRMITGLLAFAFACYLVPGLTQSKYANLKLLSGFPPPLSYSIYGKDNVHGKGLEPDVINDYEKALALSKKTGKPLLIDFTGWACVNCRKMEEQIWTKPSVQQLIKDNYILVSLYVDDRGKMENGESIGSTWASFQSENFGQVTQPLYVQLSPEEELLNHPVGYTPSASEYENWLECGIRTNQNPLTKQ